MALLLMWLLIVATSMILVLFYKGGPNLRKGEVAYERRTLHNFLLCWQVRKMTLDPDALEAQIQEKALLDKLNVAAVAEIKSIDIEQGTQDEIDQM